MTTALTTQPEARMVTPDDMALVKNTVAIGATDSELKLFLFDCARQGVHPLDRLIHFTKRSGKYTPVTSIDFMRTRAADTGEMAGSDDPKFEQSWHREGFVGEKDHHEPYPSSATVTVYRMTHGQRFAYTATARWSEYKPEQNDFMWRKMPHTMLAKCAEALALRKGFPRQLAGLYAKEELDQADSTSRVVVEAPPALVARQEVATASPRDQAEPSVPNGGELGTPPPGAVYITNVELGTGKVKGWLHHSGQTVSLHGMDGLGIYDERVVTIASECCQARTPVMLELKTPPSGKPYVIKITTVKPAPSDAELDAEIARRELATHAGEIL